MTELNKAENIFYQFRSPKYSMINHLVSNSEDADVIKLMHGVCTFCAKGSYLDIIAEDDLKNIPTFL